MRFFCFFFVFFCLLLGKDGGQLSFFGFFVLRTRMASSKTTKTNCHFLFVFVIRGANEQTNWEPFDFFFIATKVFVLFCFWGLFKQPKNKKRFIPLWLTNSFGVCPSHNVGSNPNQEALNGIR